MSVRIIIDSTCDLPEELMQRTIVVPLSVHFGDETYLDGVTISRRTFYEKLIESDVMPTTSQATPMAFMEVYEKVVSQGDEAVVLTIASQLSGTYQSAVLAARDYPGKIHVVDSHSVALGSAILAEYALNLADQGMNGADIANELNSRWKDVRLIALLDTLEYLKKGGRISKAVAFAGGLLSIKPVVCVEDGEIKVLGKARGSKQGNNLLFTEIKKAGGVDYSMPLVLGYTGLNDQLLKKYMEDSGSLWKDKRESLPYTCVGSVVGTHAGP